MNFKKIIRSVVWFAKGRVLILHKNKFNHQYGTTESPENKNGILKKIRELLWIGTCCGLKVLEPRGEQLRHFFEFTETLVTKNTDSR